MAQLSTTSNATGQATTLSVIALWWLSGHPTSPMPPEVAVALGAYLAMIGHGLEILFMGAIQKLFPKSAPAIAAVAVAERSPGPANGATT